MTETFIELVPRDAPSLLVTMAELEHSDVPFDGYNIPELIGKQQHYLSPEEMCALRRDGRIHHEKKLVVHLRTRDRTRGATLDRLRLAARSRIDMALLVSGDACEGAYDSGVRTKNVLRVCDPVPLPLGVVADIYRHDWKQCHEKQDAIRVGIVDALFTQPIFDPSLFDEIHAYTDALVPREKVFAGITWIGSERSRRYWNEKNSVPLSLLPKGASDAEIKANSLAKSADVLQRARELGSSIYIMLMRNTVCELRSLLLLAE